MMIQKLKNALNLNYSLKNTVDTSLLTTIRKISKTLIGIFKSHFTSQKEKNHKFKEQKILSSKVTWEI